jgi:hypothetical protein
MFRRSRVGLIVIVAAMVTGAGEPRPPESDPAALWAGGWAWAITDVQRDAIRPIALRRLALKSRLNEAIGEIAALKRDAGVPVVISRSGIVPLDEDLPRSSGGSLWLNVDLPCFQPCVPMRPWPGRCVAPEGIGWPSLELPWVEPEARPRVATRPSNRARSPAPCRATDVMQQEIDDLEVQLGEIETILPRAPDPAHLEDVLRCMAAATGVRPCSLWVDKPRDSHAFIPTGLVREMAIVAAIEGPPAAVQDWFVRLSHYPYVIWFDDVTLRSDTPGSPLVIAEVRARAFAARAAP